MVLELHIWGPAFSLPSIDAQCIAAAAYMTQTVPRGEWILIASSDPSLTPTKELPALRNETVWIGGFRNIVDYVTQFSSQRWSLDANLEGRGRADCIAFSSFIEEHGQPLIDLSLYVSTQNYTAITRPIFTTIQPFPLPYITPSSIRSAAKSRTDHLGLSSLDIDSDNPDSKREESIIPPSLRKSRMTISSLLSQSPENAAQIRLDALATTFLDPLQSLRGKKRYFVSQYPTSFDCLAFGYLSLALLPDLPSPWLANTMRAKYPQLCAFVHDLQRSCFNGAVTLNDACLVTSSSFSGEEAEVEQKRRRRASGKAILPWSPPDRGNLLALGGIMAASMADHIPGISQFRHAKRLERELGSLAENEEERQDAVEVVSIYRHDLWMTTAAVVGSVGLLLGYMFQHGLLAPLLGGESPRTGYHDGLSGSHVEQEEQSAEEDEEVEYYGTWPERRPPRPAQFPNLGDLGAALSGLPSLSAESPPSLTDQSPVPAVEVDVEIDNRRD